MQGRVSVNIVTWNSMAYLPECLESLKNQTFRDLEIVVVDNSSDDGSSEYVERTHPGITRIRNTDNRGFCGGHNIAIRRNTSEFVLPLNPDVQLTPTYIAELVHALNNDADAGIAAGKLFLPGGAILDGAGMSLSRVRRQYLRGHDESDTGIYDRPVYLFGVDGSAPLYRRAMLEEIRIGDEYFDEDFFAHKEDLDLSWRSQLYGWKCRYVPTAVAVHDRSFRPESPGSRAKMSEEVRLHAVKNRYLAMVKNDMPALFFADLPFILWYDLKILVYLLLRERSSLAAIPMFLRLLPKALGKRRIIRAHTRVTPAYMRSLLT